jgi:DNA repair exonuclease SbcCD ATPase subunit
MAEYKHHSNYFYGNKISDYGIQHKRVDYATLAKAFDAVLNNDIMQKTADIGYWEQESGFIDNSAEIEELENQIAELEDDEANEEKVAELEEQIKELEEEQDYYHEIYQYYIVSDNGAEILKRFNEIVFYNEELDMYIWGVTHWGTSWDYVLTDIEICEYND